MGFIVGVVVLLVAAALLAGSVRDSRLLRPYIGLFIIAALMAVAAAAVSSLFNSLGAWLMIGAKLVAVVSCVALCVHLAIIVGKRTLSNERPPRS